MINKIWKHNMLRLDLMNVLIVNQFPEKTVYQYPNRSEAEWPKGFMFKKFSNKVVIEKDVKSNILWFEKSFFDEIITLYQMSVDGLSDEECIINDFESNFFNCDESIGAVGFNPAIFGIGMQIKIANASYAPFFGIVLSLKK